MTYDGPDVLTGLGALDYSSVPYRLRGGGIFFNQGYHRSTNPEVGSLSLLIIMLLVDIIILECSLEEHRKLCTVVPWISGLVMIEAVVF